MSYLNLIFFSLFSIDETLEYELQEYVKPPALLFPLDQDSGTKDYISEDVVGIETDLAYNDLWTPAGLKGSPLFDGHFTNEASIKWPLKNEIELDRQCTITMWVKPNSYLPDTVIFVSCTFC